jgi:hypothetical protein
LYPYEFLVPDHVWRYYMGTDDPHRPCCFRCWSAITNLLDGGRYQDIFGRPVEASEWIPLPHGGLEETDAMDDDEFEAWMESVFENPAFDAYTKTVRKRP